MRISREAAFKALTGRKVVSGTRHEVRRVNKSGAVSKAPPYAVFSGPKGAERAASKVEYLRRLNPGTEFTVTVAS